MYGGLLDSLLLDDGHSNDSSLVDIGCFYMVVVVMVVNHSVDNSSLGSEVCSLGNGSRASSFFVFHLFASLHLHLFHAHSSVVGFTLFSHSAFVFSALSFFFGDSAVLKTFDVLLNLFDLVLSFFLKLCCSDGGLVSGLHSSGDDFFSLFHSFVLSCSSFLNHDSLLFNGGFLCLFGCPCCFLDLFISMHLSGLKGGVCFSFSCFGGSDCIGSLLSGCLVHFNHFVDSFLRSSMYSNGGLMSSLFIGNLQSLFNLECVC